MTATIVCTDGSDLAIQAASAGLALLRPTDTVIVVTVVDGIDPVLMADGGGHAGASMTPAEFDRMRNQALASANEVVQQTAAALALDNVETRVLDGSPGPTICALASALSASALIMGTRGRGGIKRALLGSVSDHVVRNAPCPVLVIGESAQAS